MAQHPNVVRVWDVGESGDLHYVIMEYLDGITLADLFEGAVDTIGDRPALITGGSEVATRRWTYAELDEEAATTFTNAGVRVLVA